MKDFKEVGVRFSKYLIKKKLGVNEAARLLGYSGSQISNIKNGKVFGADKMFNILNVFSDINPNWLLMGDGYMLKTKQPISLNSSFGLRSDHNIEQQQIPLYNIEATAGLVPLFESPNQIKTEEFISIPRIPKCDGALFVTGDSMYPLLKSGDIVAYQKVYDKQNSIFWGEMYLISLDVDGEEYVTVKYVQKSEEGKEYVKLVSENRHHQPKDVHLDKIRALAMVKASVRINSM